MSTTISDSTGNILGDPERAQVLVTAIELGKDPLHRQGEKLWGLCLIPDVKEESEIYHDQYT